MDKKGRNDPCPCGSGKKFKKCCESARSLGLRKYQLSEKGPEKQDVTSLFQRTFVPKEKN